MNKLKIAGLLVSAAGFLLGLVASNIEDKKMEEAVEETVAKHLGELSPTLGEVPVEETDTGKKAKIEAMKNAGYSDEEIAETV